MSAWNKKTVKLAEASYVKRAWVIDLDKHLEETGIEITPRDLFDPTLFCNVRTKKLFDRGDDVTSLREGEVCRVIRQEGPDPYDIDLCCVAALPGGLVMELRGARTPWAKLLEVEKEAVAKRRASVREAAVAAAGDQL